MRYSTFLFYLLLAKKPKNVYFNLNFFIMGEQNFRSKFDRIVICRTSADKNQSLGVGLCLAKNGDLLYSFRTLELPWRENEIKRSRIPVGSYTCKKWNSPTHELCFKIMQIVGRKNILIHKGNYYFQTEGCILVGDHLNDINADGKTDVLNSGIVLSHLLNLAPESFLIIFK